MSKELFRGPALKITQPIGEFWVAVIPARILLLGASPDPLRLVVDKEDVSALAEWTKGRTLLGSQRGLNDRKLREIGAYVDALDATFPNAIIISANSDIAANEPDENAATTRASAVSRQKADWFIDYIDEDESRPELVIPENPRQAAVVDGQHRLFGFLHSKVKTRKNFNLVCAVFFGLPLPLQAAVFATINTKQTPVRRAMALNLFGYNVDDEPREVWSPVKLAVFVARRLNWEDDSPLCGKIKIEAVNAPRPGRLPGSSRALSLAAVVDGITDLLSATPAEDANTLKSERTIRKKKRKNLSLAGPLLRAWYVAEADRSIFELIKEFCSAVNDVFWRSAPPGSMLVRAVGVRALFAFLWQAGSALGVPVQPPEDREELMRKFRIRAREELRKASHIDFTDLFFEASGRGQTRIANVLLVATRHMEIATVPAEDLADYRRVLGFV